VGLQLLQAVIGAARGFGDLPACQVHQLARSGHELVLANPPLGGDFQQVLRNVRYILAQQAKGFRMGFEISRCRGTVAQAKFPDNPPNRRRDRPLLRLRLLVRFGEG